MAGFGVLVVTSAGAVGLLTMVFATVVFAVGAARVELIGFCCFNPAAGWGLGALGLAIVTGAIASGGVFLAFLTSTTGLEGGLVGGLTGVMMELLLASGRTTVLMGKGSRFKIWGLATGGTGDITSICWCS
jgi:hypothetical protein